jgi:F420-dependent methylenetetrahydromethanopterin dehydrogenase
VPLIDGRGVVHRPHSTDAARLLRYTIGHQVVETFDFTKALHTALHHCAPDVVIALGPGNALGGPIARTLIWSRWRSIRSRHGFDAVQASDAPALLSCGVRLQRSQVVR